MVFVADDLADWLIGTLADAGRKKLTQVLLGTEQERALRKAATTAVQLTAAELCPGDEAQAAELAMVVSEVFGEPTARAPLAGHTTVLEALGAGIAAQLAVLDDASLTGTGQSSADVLGIPATVVAGALTGHLLREIATRGAAGGLLFPLASQLNDDMTHLQGQRLEDMLGQLADDVRQALTRLDAIRAAAAAAPTALAQLPPLTAGFTGRDGELAVLADLLNPAGTGGAALVAAVAGLAGVGKTTLAVAAGHAAVKRGWFSGGVLFLDLHGYDATPVEPGQALDALLRSLGVLAEHIPPTAEQRAALYRSVLAQTAGPVLVIADNASSEAPVRPLLPGAGPHKVIVTSRHTLAGLGAGLVDVAVLDEVAGIELLDAALRIARSDDDRITGDPAAAEQLARACSGLPLALQIVAALLIADPALTAGELAAELSEERERLDRLRYDDGNGQAGMSVAAAFELSYRRLDETQARVFRLLPVSPGPDASAAGTSVLADLPVSQVRPVLADLARAHLAEAAPGAPGRWRMHDLVRLYAARLGEQHARGDGREQARDRLLGYYLATADAADDHLHALPGMAAPDAFTGREDALAWLDAERASLVAAVTMAAATGRDQAAMRLPLTLAAYLQWRRRFDDWLAITTISLSTARRLGDQRGEGAALNNLGNVLQQVRRFEEAVTACKDAAAIYRQGGDRRREGNALTNLAGALLELRRFDEAIAACQDAAAIYHQTGDRNREGMALGNLGAALTEVRQFDEAIIAQRGAATIHRQTGDRHSEGNALNNLGVILQQMRRFDEAIIASQDAAAIFRETGDRHREATALNNLGISLQQTGRFEKAITAHQDAAAVYRDTGDRHDQAMTLNNIGIGLQQMHRFDEAIAACLEATTIFRDTGDRQRQAKTLGNLGLALAEVHRFGEAVTAHQDAAAIYRETGDRHGEGTALEGLGLALHKAQRFRDAITAYQDAISIYQETGDRYRKGMALEHLARARTAQST